MPYEPYVTPDEYDKYSPDTQIPDEDQAKMLMQASRHIDSLTYNRIVGQGISNLTQFQREIVRKVVCQQAEFEYLNREIFEMILSGYSINGVSMQFGESWNVAIQKGIPVKRDVYEQLCQTGLCCRLLR